MRDEELGMRNFKINKSALLTALGLFFISIALWADGDVFSYPLKPETMDAFKAVSERLAEHPIVKGNFEQEKILSRLGRSLKSEGNFIIVADLGMVWDTIKPFPSTLTLGKDYLMQSRPGGQKTKVSAQGNETFLRMAEVISAVFSGNAQGLLDNFEVYFAIGNTAGGSGSAGTWELGLSPLDKAISTFAAKITMSGDSAIRNIIINEQSGDITKYSLSNHNYPPELNVHEKALFTLP